MSIPLRYFFSNLLEGSMSATRIPVRNRRIPVPPRTVVKFS
jgi:hypothetical protein